MRFSELRKAAGFPTQAALADKLGIKDRSTIARWEIGISCPRTHKLPAIAKILNVSEGEIIAAITATRETGNT